MYKVPKILRTVGGNGVGIPQPTGSIHAGVIQLVWTTFQHNFKIINTKENFKCHLQTPMSSLAHSGGLSSYFWLWERWLMVCTHSAHPKRALPVPISVLISAITAGPLITRNWAKQASHIGCNTVDQYLPSSIKLIYPQINKTNGLHLTNMSILEAKRENHFPPPFRGF